LKDVLFSEGLGRV